ncbi:hypothetical protein VCR14J2_390032 [Vibrio coralliirubri]|nr:hypothetical protein VCR14J2_390032 [Vibrio coralliirubri]
MADVACSMPRVYCYEITFRSVTYADTLKMTNRVIRHERQNSNLIINLRK